MDERQAIQTVIHRLMDEDGRFDGEALWAIAKLATACDILPEELLELSMVTVAVSTVKDEDEMRRIAIVVGPFLKLSTGDCRRQFVEGKTGVRVHKTVANQLQELWKDRDFDAHLHVIA